MSSLSAFSDVIDRLDSPVKIRAARETIAFFCPLGCNTKSRKARVWIGNDGNLMLGCWACGTPHSRSKRQELLKALGLEWRDLYADRQQMAKELKPIQVNVTNFLYRSESGLVLYRVKRTDKVYPGNLKKKMFSQQRPFTVNDHMRDQVDGKWIADMEGVRRVIYQLPETLKSIQAKKTILFVEGEKKVHLLNELGFASTCIAGGANSPWIPGYSKSLTGADVIILPDAGTVGGEFGRRVFSEMLLSNVINSVGILNLPNLPDKGDIVDWVQAHQSAEYDVIAGDLRQLVSNTYRFGKK